MTDLCAEHDTPLFIFDEVRLRENYRRFSQAFKNHYSKTIVCYSIKTNYNLALCRIMREEGAYAEVASGLDLYVARKAGFPAERIILDGLYKPERVLQEAVEAGCLLINVESFSELKMLNRIAGELSVKQNIGVRVNPFRPSAFGYEAILCNPSSRFGFSLEDAYGAFERASELEHLKVNGIMMHPYNEAIGVLLPFMRGIRDELGIEIEYLNLGGGFDPGTTGYISTQNLAKDFLRQKLGLGSKLIGKKDETEIEKVASSLTNSLRRALGNMAEPTIILEPGRYVVSDAGLLLLKVDHIKEAGGYKWIVVDGGTNLVPHYKEQREIQVANRGNASPKETVNIVGPILFPIDFVAIKSRLPEIRDGDTLAVFDCGAYTLSKSTQFLYPRPSAIMIDSEGKIVKIRERETFEDVTRMDRMV